MTITVVRVTIKGRVATKVVVLHDKFADLEAATECLRYECRKMQAKEKEDVEISEKKKKKLSVYQLEVREDNKPKIIWPGLEYEQDFSSVLIKPKTNNRQVAIAAKRELSESVARVIENMSEELLGSFGSLVHDVKDRNWPAIILDPRLFYSRPAYERLLSKPQHMLVLFLGVKPQCMFGSLRQASKYNPTTPMPQVSRRGIALAQELAQIKDPHDRLIRALQVSGFSTPSTSNITTTKITPSTKRQKKIKDNNTDPESSLPNEKVKKVRKKSISSSKVKSKKQKKGTNFILEDDDDVMILLLIFFSSKPTKKKRVVQSQHISHDDGDSVHLSDSERT